MARATTLNASFRKFQILSVRIADAPPPPLHKVATPF